MAAWYGSCGGSSSRAGQGRGSSVAPRRRRAAARRGGIRCSPCPVPRRTALKSNCAYLAGQRPAAASTLLIFLPSQRRVSLAVGVPAQEVPALHLAFALVAHLAREVRRLAVGHRCADRLGHRVHHVRLEQEALDDLLVPTSAVGRLARIPGRFVARSAVLRPTPFGLRNSVSAVPRQGWMLISCSSRESSITCGSSAGSCCQPFWATRSQARTISSHSQSGALRPASGMALMVSSCVWQRCQTQRNVHDGGKKSRSIAANR